ncbi:MAG: TIGR00730 family Rossman fold protein [Planctomycetes bacterium]|nr:TIGR00730 family Rossman fold protein [Planctomycetota bacterium]
MNENQSVQLQQILNSSSYTLAERDIDFLARSELRPVRMQLELLKPEMALVEYRIESTIVCFGGTQVVEREAAQQRVAVAEKLVKEKPDCPASRRKLDRARRLLAKAGFYDHAREFAHIASKHSEKTSHREYVIVTGGGPGIMEAANRGAFDVNAKSIGLNITLPHEQVPNSYITPELCFQFHYFALRKMHFLLRAKALVVFPGGFGTLDELFDALTLRQTGKLQKIPIILFGRAYWNKAVDFQFLADEGVIADADLDLISYAETAQEAWDAIVAFPTE